MELRLPFFFFSGREDVRGKIGGRSGGGHPWLSPTTSNKGGSAECLCSNNNHLLDICHPPLGIIMVKYVDGISHKTKRDN